MARCLKCGKNVIDFGDNFCRICGARLEPGDADFAEDIILGDEERKKRRKAVFLALAPAMLVVISVICFLFVYYWRDTPEKGITRYYDACKARDCGKILSCFAGVDKEKAEKALPRLKKVYENATFVPTVTSFRILSSAQRARFACSVEVEENGKLLALKAATEKNIFYMAKERGKWKIDLEKTDPEFDRLVKEKVRVMEIINLKFATVGAGTANIVKVILNPEYGEFVEGVARRNISAEEE
jgi:predicted nucleic acid-binding Zn ribbon protein